MNLDDPSKIGTFRFVDGMLVLVDNDDKVHKGPTEIYTYLQRTLKPAEGESRVVEVMSQRYYSARYDDGR